MKLKQINENWSSECLNMWPHKVFNLNRVLWPKKILRNKSKRNVEKISWIRQTYWRNQHTEKTFKLQQVFIQLICYTLNLNHSFYKNLVYDIHVRRKSHILVLKLFVWFYFFFLRFAVPFRLLHISCIVKYIIKSKY